MSNISVHNMTRMVTKYRREILLGLCTVVCTLAGFAFYKWFEVRRERAAYELYSECIKKYEGDVAAPAQGDTPARDGMFTSELAKWQAVEDCFEQAYKEQSRSGLSGVFLLYVAEAQLRQHKHESALLTMEKAIPLVPCSLLRSWFEAKQALMQLDSEDAAARTEGLAKLETLARDQHQEAFDYALYHLGNYYWLNGDFDQARSYWNSLALAARSQNIPSPWYALAKSRLKLVQE